MGDRTAQHVVITGRVQRVGFRWWMQATADGLGLGGWVRNRIDGSVEAVLVGRHDAVQRMVAACHDGPPAARVDTVVAAPARDDQVAAAGEGSLVSLPTA